VGGLAPQKLKHFFIPKIRIKLYTMPYEPNYYEINIYPILVSEGKEYPFIGNQADHCVFIVEQLREHLGEVDIKEGYKTGTFEIKTLSQKQMIILRDMHIDTASLLKHTYLRFNIGIHKFDTEPCTGRVDCECAECPDDY
jgi:hypothetical protein